MDAKIRAESHDLLRLVKFTKTNGQKSNINGLDCYTMEATVETAAVLDCAMTGFMMGGWNGSFEAIKAQKNASELDKFNPTIGAYAGNKQVAKGERMAFNIKLSFDLTERGWRSEGKLPDDIPFKPEPIGQTSGPTSKLILGKWRGGRHITTYFPNGTWNLDPTPGAEPIGKWQINGSTISQKSFDGTDVGGTIVTLSDDELIIKDTKGNTFHSQRVLP